MIFLNIYTYKEGQKENHSKAFGKGNSKHEGVKIHGEWTALDGSGGYMIFETNSPDYSWTMMWNDLLDMEIVPVLDTEKDVMGLLK